MANETQSVKPAITEGEIVAFLKYEHKALAVPAWAILGIVVDPRHGPRWMIYGTPDTPPYNFITASERKLEDAAAKFAALLPADGLLLAQRKREEARRLMAEADAIISEFNVNTEAA